MVDKQLCTPLSTPTGGSIALETDGQATTANYTCTAGYTLFGEGLITCQKDKSWDLDIPYCSQCNSLNTPSSIVVDMTTDGHVTSASFTCVSGYTRIGSSSRTCMTDGTWTSTNPVCVCNDPLFVQNGFVIADGNTANYSCSLGFSLSGTDVRTCLNDGTGWSGQDPTCVLCATLADPVGGSFSIATSGTVTSATYTCESGYTLSGQSIVGCQSSGIWDTLPTCVQCEQLLTPDSGTVSITTKGLVSMVTYACATGYDLNGVSTRTCSSDGTWTSTDPTCVCQSPSQPANGHVTDDGHTATYTCQTGYSLSGQSVRTCSTDGTGWSDTDPVCVKCADLSTINGGSYTTTTDGLHTAVAYTCDVGYTLNGVTSMVCDSSGVWNATEPECVLCPTLAVPSSGSVTIATDGYISTATFTCAAGYYVSGESSLACLTSGQWAQNSPTCKCNLPAQPADGVVSVSDSTNGQIATYTCNTGHTLFGLSSRQCLIDGTGWEGTDPTCTSCTLSSTPPETSAVLSTDGIVTMITYACAHNYSLSGTSIQVCQSDGTWSDTVPTCNVCSAYTAPDGGNVAIETDGLMTSLAFTCDLGYTINGAKGISCNAGGNWNGSEPTCVACPTLSDPASGTVSLTTDGHVTMATFTCVSGYYLSGQSPLSCQTTGLWNGNAPTCECNFPASPDNGDVFVKDTVAGTVAEYTCDTSYTLSGPSTRVCQNDGTGWTGEEPTCVACTLSPTPQETSAVLSTDGIVTMVIYTCAQNYSLSGTSIQVCQSDGTWSDTVPICNSCSQVTQPTGGSISIVTDTLITSAAYTCDVGYTLEGSRDISCQPDGVWNGTEPTCVACPVISNPDNGAVTTSSDGYTTTAGFTCVTGYYLSGQASISCQTDGAWDDGAPTCECDFPANPTNGDVSVTDTADGGTVAAYTCNTNYTLSGSATRVCQNDGTGWTGTEPTCVSCSAIVTAIPLSATFSTSGTVTSVTYACSVNYTLIGTASQSCGSDGMWTATPPTCEPCNAKSPIASGSVVFSTNGSVTQAMFTCVSGYSLNSTGMTTCLPDGTWDQLDPVCLCNPVTAPSNGDVILSADGRGANYSCANDYMVVGPTWRICLNDGTGWNGTQPTCELIVAAPAASTEDSSQFPIHIGLFIALMLLIVLLIGLVAFCAYRRFKNERHNSKIGTSSDKNQPITAPEREKSFGSDKISKDVEMGKTFLIGKATGKKPQFDVRELTPTPPHEVPNVRFDSDRPTQLRIRKDSPSKPPRDLPPRPKARNVPLTSVRLPKLKTQPPKGTDLPRQKKRRKKKETPKENLLNESSSGSSSTPIELHLERENTQDLLSTAEFDYIHPVYCHEAMTPEPTSKSRPTTSNTSGRKRSVDGGQTDKIFDI